MKNETTDFTDIEIPETLKFMVGSEGSADYLILGHKDHFNVGLRPLFDKGGPLVGFRVRIMWGDEEITPMNLQETLKLTFPNVPFTRLTDKHGSITGGIFLKGVDFSTVKLPEWMDKTDFVNNVITSVGDMTGIELEHREDVQKVLDVAYKNMFTALGGKTKSKSVKSKPKADVLAFPTKDAKGADDDKTNGDDTGAV